MKPAVSHDPISAPAIERDDAFDFGSEEYARLHASSNATAFQHPLWLASFYRHLAGPRGATKVVVTGRDRASGELLFVLPLISRRKSGIVLLEGCDLGVSDYSAPVVARHFRTGGELAAAILPVLPPHDLMRIRPVREEHVAAWRFFLGGETEKLDFSAHAAALGADFGKWRREAWEPSMRSMLDRKKKRFLKLDGAAVRRIDDPAAVAAAIRSLAAMRAGRFEGDMIQDGHVADFYAEVAAAGATAGLARTYAICAGGETIGHAFGLTHAGRFAYLLIGCDYDGHGRHSPGLLLYDAMIEDWMAAGGRVFDFTIGDEPFKKQFGTEPTAIFAITARPTWLGRLASAGQAARGHLRRLREGKSGE